MSLTTVDGSLISSGAITLTTQVTGTLPEANGGTGTTVGYCGFKSRIINGAMVIDQRNAGASVTTTNNVAYIIDRYRLVALGTSLGFSAQQVSTTATGFSKSLLATVTTAKAVASTDQTRIDQFIEGYNIADLGWGTASAQTITISFWVRSSITGTYCVGLGNAASPTRSYIATYTINSANTFEYKTITIIGDTSGSWGSTNSYGINVSFILGMGTSFNGSAGWQAGEFYQTSAQTQWIATNGATFYITGVQLEKGSTATSFDYRPYGTELALCQRYYSKGKGDARGGLNTSTQVGYQLGFAVEMRTTPTIVITTTTGTPNQASQRADGFLFYGTTGENTGTWTASAEL